MSAELGACGKAGFEVELTDGLALARHVRVHGLKDGVDVALDLGIGLDQGQLRIGLNDETNVGHIRIQFQEVVPFVIVPVDGLIQGCIRQILTHLFQVFVSDLWRQRV